MLDKLVTDSLLSEVPSEVFDAISPLSNKNSQAIFIALLKKEQMRFGELKDLFHVKYSEDINSPLKALVKAGLVSKRAEYAEDIGDNEIAVYCPSFMGKALMRALYRSVMIGIEHIPTNQSQLRACDHGRDIAASPYAEPSKPGMSYQFLANKIEYQPITQAGGGVVIYV